MVNIKTNRNNNKVHIINHQPVQEQTSIEVSNFPTTTEVSNFPAHPTSIEVSNFPAHPTSIEVSNLITGKSETSTADMNQNLMYGMRPDLSTLQTLAVDNSGKLKIYNSVSTGPLNDVIPNTDNFTRQAIFANDGSDVRIVKCDTDGKLLVKVEEQHTKFVCLRMNGQSFARTTSSPGNATVEPTEYTYYLDLRNWTELRITCEGVGNDLSNIVILESPTGQISPAEEYIYTKTLEHTVVYQQPIPPFIRFLNQAGTFTSLNMYIIGRKKLVEDTLEITTLPAYVATNTQSSEDIIST